MNNKYLAIGLSVVAVIVLIYQLFLRKSSEQIGRQLNPPAQQAQPVPSTAGRPDQTLPRSSSASAGTNTSPGQSGPIIDYHSEILLKRIPPELAEPYSKRELPPDIGRNIFTKGKIEEDSPAEPQYEREVEFKLNAIILDDKRRIAIINDKILEIGDTIQGAVVKAIIKSNVVLEIKKKKVILSTNDRIQRVRLLSERGQSNNELK